MYHLLRLSWTGTPDETERDSRSPGGYYSTPFSLTWNVGHEYRGQSLHIIISSK